MFAHRTVKHSLFGLMAGAAGLAMGAAGLFAAEPAGDAAALAVAAKDFAAYCAPCHGAGGKGNGPIAGRLNIAPANLTSISQRNGGSFPAADVYNKIEGLSMPQAHGRREMPIWGDVFVTQALGQTTSLADAKAATQRAKARIGALVDYLRSIQAAP
jgi:mono/diheme cytochrome c family protein